MSLDSELEKEIVRQLGDGRRPDDVVPLVCTRTGLKWDAAREEVLRVRARHRESISRRRTWLLFGVWVPTLIAGSVVTIGSLLAFLSEPRDYGWHLLMNPHSLMGVGMGILAFGGSLMVWFQKKKSPKR